MTHNQQQKIPLIILLILASFAAFGAVLPTPTLPKITQYFHVSAASAESLMSWYLIGYAVGQLFYGPLANWLGRKKSLFIGGGIAMIGNFMAIIAAKIGSFELLVIARFFTAVGAASGLVISMILIKDTLHASEARGAFAKLVIAFAFVPFLVIALGGSLTHHFGWSFINVAMLLYTLLALALTCMLPETLPRQHHVSLSCKKLFHNYAKLFVQTKYMKLVLLFATGTVINYIFNSVAPLIAIRSMHVTAQTYGWLSIIPAVGIFLGALISNYCAKKISAHAMIYYGLGLTLFGGLFLAALFSLGALNLVGMFFAAMFIFCGTSLIIPNASMEALTHVSDHAHGASLMNAIVLILGGLGVNAAGAFIDNSVMTLPIAVLIISVFGLLLIVSSKISCSIKNRLALQSR